MDKHLPVSIASEMGHLRQEKQHLQSTSVDIDTEFFPARSLKTQNVVFAIKSILQKILRLEI